MDKIEIFFINLRNNHKQPTTKMNVQYIQNAIVKQTTVNLIPLPDLVLAEIKDYLFYDPRASKQIQETRKYKSNTLNKIKNAYTWFDAPMPNNVYATFEGVYCGKCGNFKGVYPRFSKKYNCTC
jgi:hypothetical protein